MGIKAAMIVLAASAPSVALASDADRAAEIEQYVNNYSHNNMICGGYFFFVSQCVANRGPSDKPLSEQYKKGGMIFVQRAIEAGKAVGVSEKAMIARMDIAVADMKDQTENNCINISVLYKQHAQKCKALMDNGPAELASALEALGIK